ncbi:hypothetical protein F1D05_19270 [Kribbella qitaiheensis]|uniref:DUF222 domain-containing protein n=1 Tax=Kribbella qitaiheensis TaxID=1544730 RepID=A0A7G6X0A1_9ACTN|nr:hypothetical protein [Kribbella qitaiheensis]QNE19666.1 hypothetical protein F1D05_19270 [Kribbella qitaiheensis]
MFAIDLAGCDTAETLSLAAAAHERQRESELELILLAQHYAELHPAPSRVRDDGLPGGEQARVYGGEGCPEIAEFAVAEFGAVIGRSSASAARFIGQAVALPYRFPLTWERVQSGAATGWKALQVVQDCVTLSLAVAAIVDRRVADIIDSVTLIQLKAIIKAAMWEADAGDAKAKAEARAKERGVWVGRTDDHGTTTLFVKGATGDIIALNATIAQLADALAAVGDTDPLDQRRAKAAGLLSDPGLAADLLAAAARHLSTTAAGPDRLPVDEDNELAIVRSIPDPARHPATQSGDGLAEPGPDDADRDTPHPNTPNHPLDHHPQRTLTDHERSATPATRGEPSRPDQPPRSKPGSDEVSAPADVPVSAGMDAVARLELRRRIEAVRGDHPDRRRIYQTVVNLHITDETLLAGAGTARVEGYGPVYTGKLEELLGHHRIVLRPVIDLGTALSVHAYEIPGRIRDHNKLRYPVEQFPYGTGETTTSTDLDHIRPYRPGGPPGQTSTGNLVPH